METKHTLHPDDIITLYASSIVEEMDELSLDTEEEFNAFLDDRKAELYSEIQMLMGDQH